jgi:hypothetical protein
MNLASEQSRNPARWQPGTRVTAMRMLEEMLDDRAEEVASRLIDAACG